MTNDYQVNHSWRSSDHKATQLSGHFESVLSLPTAVLEIRITKTDHGVLQEETWVSNRCSSDQSSINGKLLNLLIVIQPFLGRVFSVFDFAETLSFYLEF